MEFRVPTVLSCPIQDKFLVSLMIKNRCCDFCYSNRKNMHMSAFHHAVSQVEDNGVATDEVFTNKIVLLFVTEFVK